MLRENILKRIKQKDIELVLLDSVSSTNDYLKNLAKNGAKENTVVISNIQTAGKGTKGRTFVSREGGVYLSILLQPDFNSFDTTLITPMTAVAVSEAIDKISGKSTQIKWVNDIYLGGKKVCGILCESGYAADCDKPYVVVGIGVNFFKPKNDFDADIKDIATSVFENENEKIKEDFIAILIDDFFDYYSNISKKTFIKKYQSTNFVIGKMVDYLIDGEYCTAKAVAIDENCRLVVELPDKSIKTISSGDITIKR